MKIYDLLSSLLWLLVGLAFLVWVTDRAVRRPRVRPAAAMQTEAAS